LFRDFLSGLVGEVSVTVSVKLSFPEKLRSVQTIDSLYFHSLKNPSKFL
jgi:hypothetical protein